MILPKPNAEKRNHFPLWIRWAHLWSVPVALVLGLILVPLLVPRVGKLHQQCLLGPSQHLLVENLDDQLAFLPALHPGTKKRSKSAPPLKNQLVYLVVLSKSKITLSINQYCKCLTLSMGKWP